MSFFEAIGAFFQSLPGELYVFLISILPIVELRGAIPVGALAFQLPFYWNYALSVIGNMLPIPFILLFIPKILDLLARIKLFRPVVLWLRKKADKHKDKVLGNEADTSLAEADAGISGGAPELCELEAAAEDGVIADGGAAGTKAENGTAETAEIAEKRDTPPTMTENAAGDFSDEVISAKNSVRPMTKGIFIALMLFVAIPIPGTGAWTGSLIAALFNLPKRSSFLSVLLGVLISGVIMTLASYGVVGFLDIFMPH